MVNLFKKIRRNFVLQNKSVKYFRYAIGEIVLVVIGILIALQINNWNESRKERKREEMYLQALQIDLKESQVELERVINKTGRIMAASARLLEYSKDTAILPPPAVFDSLVMETFGYTIAMTNEGTINDISGSGDLKVIRNDSLRRMIASWDAGFKMIRERERLLKSAFQENRDMLNIRIDLYNGVAAEKVLMDEQTRKLIITDISHRNGLVNLIMSSSPLNDLYRGKIRSLDNMIAITESELEEL